MRLCAYWYARQFHRAFRLPVAYYSTMSIASRNYHYCAFDIYYEHDRSCTSTLASSERGPPFNSVYSAHPHQLWLTHSTLYEYLVVVSTNHSAWCCQSWHGRHQRRTTATDQLDGLLFYLFMPEYIKFGLIYLTQIYYLFSVVCLKVIPLV
jgi:hypothetical protein